MSLQVEKLEHNMAKLTIEVPAEEFEAAIEKSFQKNKSKLSAPGFRKGKITRQVAEKLFGKEIFFEDAANFAIQDAYEKAYEECEEEIVSSPSIDVVQIEAGKPFIFTAEVAIQPEVTLGAYKGVEIDKVEVEVSDEDIEAQIKKDLEAQSRQIPVEDRPVKDGDLTIIDFEGFVDGVAFEGGKGENYSLTIGSGAFIPGFEEQLIGKNLEEECEVNVTFPEDYHAENLAGKEAVFKCVIHDIKENQVPELDDDFAGDAGFDTVDEYKAEVKAKLAEQKEKSAKNAKEDAVIAAIVEKSEMDIPDAMVETQQRQMMDEFAQQLQMQGLSIQQYFQFTGLTPQAMMEQSKPQAIDRIKSRLVLQAVAKAENLEATDADVDKELEDMAAGYQMDLDQIKTMMGDYEMNMLKKDIAIKKAIDFVVENAVEK